MQDEIIPADMKVRNKSFHSFHFQFSLGNSLTVTLIFFTLIH